jgi:hypothetical protein
MWKLNFRCIPYLNLKLDSKYAWASSNAVSEAKHINHSPKPSQTLELSNPFVPFVSLWLFFIPLIFPSAICDYKQKDVILSKLQEK